MKHILSVLALFMALGLAPVPAQAEVDLRALSSNPTMQNGATVYVKPDGTTVVDPLPPECQEGGYLWEGQKAGMGYNAAQATGLAKNTFATEAFPVPNSGYNCFQRIMDLFGTFGSFSWPPDVGAFFAALIRMILNKMCQAVWDKIKSSELLTDYNKVLGGYTKATRCTRDLNDCKPIADAKDDFLGGLTRMF